MATRYNTLSDTDLAGLLDALARQLATGVASLSINGQTVTYSTPAEIRNTMADMEAELADRALRRASAGRRSPLAAQYPSLLGKGLL